MDSSHDGLVSLKEFGVGLQFKRLRVPDEKVWKGVFDIVMDDDGDEQLEFYFFGIDFNFTGNAGDSLLFALDALEGGFKGGLKVFIGRG